MPASRYTNYVALLRRGAGTNHSLASLITWLWCHCTVTLTGGWAFLPSLSDPLRCCIQLSYPFSLPWDCCLRLYNKIHNGWCRCVHFLAKRAVSLILWFFACSMLLYRSWNRLAKSKTQTILNPFALGTSLVRVKIFLIPNVGFGYMESGWLFLFAVLVAAGLLFCMVFFVSPISKCYFCPPMQSVCSLETWRLFFRVCLLHFWHGWLASIQQIIMFSDLECDYINPIDLCNKLNQVGSLLDFIPHTNICPPVQFVLPENITHAFLTLLFLLSGQWVAFILNLPLVLFNANKYELRLALCTFIVHCFLPR